MARASDFDPSILALFDGYVHGRLTRRQFLDRAAGLVAAGTSAAAVLASLSPDYALARQVDPDDPEIVAGYKQYASPAGAGVMQGYFARPADTGHKLPGVVVIHENRGLNPYIEDVARRLAVAGYLGFAPDALTAAAIPAKPLHGTRDCGFRAAVEDLRRTGGGGRVSKGMALVLTTRKGRHERSCRIAGWPEFEKALRANSVDFVEYTYAGTNHGFHNDTTPRFDAKAAKLAWERTVEFFDEHLQ